MLGLMLQRASEETSQNLTDIERFQIFAVIHFFAPEFADLQQWQRIDQLIAQYGPRALLHESPWNAESRQSRITKATLDFQDRLIGRAVAGEIDSTALIYVRLSSYGQAFESLAVRPELDPGEAWSDAFLARLDALPAAERAPWLALAAFARSASAGKPTAKWLKEAQNHVDAVGAAKFREVLTASLPLLSRPRTVALQPAQYGPDANLVLDSFNALSLKGLLWMVPLVAD
ncbi:hypothetical protein D3875_16310 [Deinococcus cavernae]|uniref:Uncharacterized protein n=1 Tax=Deinococcus cavernae TaxID=2320857 RepID=A0A418V9U2_9DEIO|nr:hypothetical protein [Deinococcus cavernae]RJF72874.1 hypothetical protein D3875_16310 [Deinococcus cavernae]